MKIIANISLDDLKKEIINWNLKHDAYQSRLAWRKILNKYNYYNDVIDTNEWYNNLSKSDRISLYMDVINFRKQYKDNIYYRKI